MNALRAWMFAKVAGRAVVDGLGITYRIIGYLIAALDGLQSNDETSSEKFTKMIVLLKAVQKFIETVASVFDIRIDAMVAATSGLSAEGLAPMLNHITQRVRDEL